MVVSRLLHWEEKTHHYILPLKCLKMPWSIVHKQQKWVTSSSAYLRIENLIEPIPNASLKGHVMFAKHTDLLYCLINNNGSLRQHVHLHKPPVLHFPLASFCSQMNLNFLLVKSRHTLAAFCKIDQKYRY